MQVGVLGPVTVIDRGVTVALDTGKQRAALATLALHRDRVVGAGELIDALWGDEPPATAAKTLQGHISALRRSCGPGVVDTVSGGYRLGGAVDTVDLDEFERAIVSGRDQLERVQPDRARRDFADAIARWRGDPLTDLADGALRAGHVARLTELRALAREGAIEAELQLGHHREVVPELERLVEEYPFREIVWRLLMVALHRSGRTAEALATFQRLREILVAVGVEPSDATRELEHRILDRDPSLAPPTLGPPTNLVATLDSFVGRERDMSRVLSELDSHRVVTLVGVGGVGKSRLAIEIGHSVLDRFEGGVWWVDLASAAESVPIATAVAAAVGVEGPSQVDGALVARLRSAPALVILDNCEHRVDDVARFAVRITTSVPSVKILATSRIGLDIPGRRRVAVEPLDTSSGPDQGAARLFRDRVDDRSGPTVDPEVALRIAQLVGGLPLGLELAAGQCATSSPRQLAVRLEDATALLAMSDPSHPDERHSSLGHVLDASLDDLDRETRRSVSLLSVLPGAFGVDLAAAVTAVERDAADLVVRAALESSLITRAAPSGASSRFRMLWPVRQHIAAHLEPRERADAERRHADHLVRFARRYLEEADTPGEVAWVDRATELDADLRLAMQWCDRHERGDSLVIAAGLATVAQLRGDQHAAADMVRSRLDPARAATTAASADEVAWAAEAVVWPELLAGDLEAASADSLDAIERFERLGQPRGLARTLRGRAHALHLMGADAATTTPIYERSIQIARSAGLDWSVAVAQVQLAHALTAHEAFETYRVVDIEEMLDGAREVLWRSDDRARLAHAALSTVFIAFGRDDVEECARAGQEMLRLSRLARAVVWEQIAHVALGVTDYEIHDEAGRREHFGAALRLAVETDNQVQLGIALHAVAATLADRRPDAAAKLWGAAGRRTWLWPLHRRRYGSWIAVARDRLGSRFDDLERAGALMPPDDLIALADGDD